MLYLGKPKRGWLGQKIQKDCGIVFEHKLSTLRMVFHIKTKGLGLENSSGVRGMKSEKSRQGQIGCEFQKKLSYSCGPYRCIPSPFHFLCKFICLWDQIRGFLANSQEAITSFLNQYLFLQFRSFLSLINNVFFRSSFFAPNLY